MLTLRLIFVTIVWGVNFSFVKYALRDFGPLSFTVVRFILGALFLLAVMRASGESFGIDRNDRGPIIRLGFTGITLYNIFFMLGLKFTTASNSALIIALSPLFAGVIQAAKGQERLTGTAVTGILLAAVGAALVIQGRDGGVRLAADGLLGDLLTLCASLFWALYTMNSKPLLEKYSAVKVTAYCMAIGSVLLLPAGAYDLTRQSWSSISLPSWAALFFAAFVSGGIAFSLWYQGVKRIGVTRTIVYHYLVPFVAVIFAALFLGERITFLQVLGGASVLTGVYLVQRGKPEGGKVGS
jgi:drug/metabolite transporter (DMT)-like permease